MKILSISVDSSVLNKDSELAKRTIEYGNAVDGYAVVAPVRGKKENLSVRLSDRVIVYGVGSRNQLFGFCNIFKSAKRLLKKEKFDLITVGDQYYLALLGWFLAKKFEIGLNLQIHGFEKYSGLRKLMAKFVIPRANTVRVVSQRLKKELIEKFKVREEKIIVVPIFTSVISHQLSVISKKFKKIGEKFVFLTVGRLVPVKNIGLQIEAMGNIVKLHPEAELWIVGSGKEEKNLKLKIKNLKLDNNIKLFGWQNDVNKFYNEADAFLLTSNYEGWGMAVVEAASCGLSIIMTDVGCAGEIIKNKESGIVIPAGDSKKLTEAMLRVMEDNDLRKNLGEGARRAMGKLPNKEETLRLYKENWEKTKKIKK